MTGSVDGRRQALARVAAVLAIIAAMAIAPGIVGWLEAIYPLGGGVFVASLQYLGAVLATSLLTFVAVVGWGWPSWVIVSRLYPADTLDVRALRAALVSFVLQPVIHATVLAIGGREMSPDRYRIAVLASQGAMLIAASLLYRGTESRADPERRKRLVALGCVTVLAAAALVSRIAWADLNPDGTELLTMGRSLGAFIVPRLPTGEIPGVNLGMLPIPYPIDWLLAIGGPSPVASRLPSLAYIGLVGLGLTAIVEHGARRRLTTSEFALLLGGTLAACLTIGFNTSYDPYSTDLASPASIDLLAMAFLMATIFFIFAGEVWWCVLACALQALTRPSALLLCGMLFAAILVVERNLRSRSLRLALIATMTAFLVSFVYAFPVETLTHAEVAEGGGNLLLRLRFLRFDDWGRLAWLVLPSGILPVMLMARWRSLDQRGRALSLMTLAYFAFFYILAFVSLHHFAPAMLLPLAVFWRTAAQNESNTGSSFRALVLAGVMVALVAALPRSLAPHRATREVGKTIAFDVGNATGAQLLRNTFDASRALDSLLTPYFRVRDPQAERVGAPLSLAWYALQARPSPDTAPYIVQPANAAPPAGTTALGSARGYTLYTRDVAAWQQLRHHPPPPDPRSRLYDVPRTTLFQHIGRESGVHQVDVREVVCRLHHFRSCAPAPDGNPRE